MSFKTISLSDEAYKILKKAKRSPRESFTEVVRRAVWDEPADTMGEALDLLEAEFGHGKTAVTAEELETSRTLHARRKARA
jgi:predicted CopG family antitoxin